MLLVTILLPGLCAADEHSFTPAQAEVIHNELRALRDAMLAAWETRDIDALLAHVDDNVVVTWQNAEVNRGHDGLRKFYLEVIDGDSPILADINSELEVTDLSILHGEDTAVAFGTMRDEITLNEALARAPFLGAGAPIVMLSQWTATLVKREGQWKLASYHTSNDVFDNAVLGIALAGTRTAAYFAGGIGVIAGIVLMLLIPRLTRSRSKA